MSLEEEGNAHKVIEPYVYTQWSWQLSSRSVQSAESSETEDTVGRVANLINPHQGKSRDMSCIYIYEVSTTVAYDVSYTVAHPSELARRITRRSLFSLVVRLANLSPTSHRFHRTTT
jgi:hypothetical protein